jgi:hypothetical protein
MEEEGITARPFLAVARHGEYWKGGTAAVLSLGERWPTTEVLRWWNGRSPCGVVTISDTNWVLIFMM